MPARRKKRRAKKDAALARNLFKYIVIVFFILTPFLYIRLTKELWDGENKLVVVTNNGESGVIVSVLDPVAYEIVNISIPGNTQVDAAGQLGVWKIGSIWELGINEGRSGQLLADTVTKNFKFPVVAWQDKRGLGLTSSSPKKFFEALIYPYKTDIKIGDKVAMGLFSMRVNNPKRVEIELENTRYLRKVDLIDGSQGFEIVGSIPQELLALFANSEISKLGLRVAIKSDARDVAVAKEVGEIVEILGAKVASIVKVDDEVEDCIVRSKDEKNAAKFARVISCNVDKGEFVSGFDLEIALGQRFAERF
jgi:hypothetical protein